MIKETAGVNFAALPLDGDIFTKSIGVKKKKVESVIFFFFFFLTLNIIYNKTNWVISNTIHSDVIKFSMATDEKKRINKLNK